MAINNKSVIQLHHYLYFNPLVVVLVLVHKYIFSEIFAVFCYFVDLIVLFFNRISYHRSQIP